MAAAASGAAVSGVPAGTLCRSAQQLLDLCSQCKESVQQLRTCVREAKSHRAKCCEVLGAAMTTILALDQAIHSPSQRHNPSHSFQKLSAEVIAAIDLAQRRVQIFSTQPRIVKYAYLPNKRAVDGKLDQVVAQLEGLTQQIWELSTEPEDNHLAASKAPPVSSKAAALDLERVYTPRSAAVIRLAMADLHEKLAAGNKSSDQPACKPIVLLQAQEPYPQQQGQTVATQTSPKLISAASFDSAQSHDQRSTLTQAELAGMPYSPGRSSFTSQPSWTASQPLQMPVGVAKAPPPPPSSGQTPGQHDNAADSAALLQRASAEWNRPLPSSLSNRSTPLALEGSSNLAQLQPQRQGSWQSPTAVGQNVAGPFAAQQMYNNAAVSEWQMQARGQTPFRTAENRPHALPEHRPHTQSEYGMPLQGAEGGRPFERSQSHTPEIRSAEQMAPSLQQGLTHQRRATEDFASRRERSRCQSETTRRVSAESQRDMYPASMNSSSIDMFEGLGCVVVPYEELDIKRKIGDGSIGQVYLGRWQQTDVAVKVLTEMQSLAGKEEVLPQDPATCHPWEGSSEHSCPQQGGTKRTRAKGLLGVNDSVSGQELSESNKAFATLEREVSIMASLRHPNVVMFMGLCLEPPCIVTEFCARGSLFDVLRKARASPPFAQQMDWPRRLGMALDASKGMLQLHSHKPPILHRDLKSPNILVERHWRVKVTDFNLSRMVQTEGRNASVTSLLANNPRWLAPEVVKDHDYSKAADVYSFGIIMWEMMTWRLPWEDLNPFQIMLRLSQQDRPDIPELDTLPGQPLPGISAYIQLMKECWDEDPAKRPGFEHIIISVRGLMESANNQHKLQKTLTAVPRLGALTTCVAPKQNKLPVVGQTPFDARGSAPQDTPTPLAPLDGRKAVPLQVYKCKRAFFGSAPVGALDILFSSKTADKSFGRQEKFQAEQMSGKASPESNPGSCASSLALQRRHSWNGTNTVSSNVMGTAPDVANESKKHVYRKDAAFGNKGHKS